MADSLITPGRYRLAILQGIPDRQQIRLNPIHLFADRRLAHISAVAEQTNLARPRGEFSDDGAGMTPRPFNGLVDRFGLA
jgi:hypothetical protein